MELDDLWEYIRGKANVVGYSKKLRPKIINGETTDDLCFRVYVSVKLPLSQINLRDLVPKEILSIQTDIIEIGRIRALGNTSRFRPLIAGISIGNWEVTAGSLGYFFKDGRGRERLGSNAHVLAEDALKQTSREKRIVQPGRVDGGTLDDVMAEYYWHKPLGNKSDCPIATGITKVLNGFSRSLGRKSRFPVPLAEEFHHIDFALATPLVDFSLIMADLESFDGFIGLGFAGSDQSSFFCKEEYIRAEGWIPIDKYTHTVGVDDRIHKVGRTTEHTSGKVLDDSVHGTVWYGDYEYVEFDDVILTEVMLEGGDSGASGWIDTSTP